MLREDGTTNACKNKSIYYLLFTNSVANASISRTRLPTSLSGRFLSFPSNAHRGNDAANLNLLST